jgi:hypothetical protein
MTTTAPSSSLDRVGAALVDAHDVVSRTTDPRAVQDALVALCRASYDVLLRWEVDTASNVEEPAPEPETWRTPLDELRVQAALAEMELRDAGVAGVTQADALVRDVSSRIDEARREVGGALASLRGELRKALR